MKAANPPNNTAGKLFINLFPSDMACDIDDLLEAKRTPDEYKGFIVDLFNEALNVASDDPVWRLLDHLDDESDYWTAPASTRFHGAEESGLVRHSLAVLANSAILCPAMTGAAPDMYPLVVASLFHDLCKVNMYEKKSRNVKNERTDAWESVPCYAVRADYLSFGHGVESMLRIGRFIELPVAWNHAVRWHMGSYDLSDSDQYVYKKALSAHKEVLLLHTADMQAALANY
jgi:hypothetical protein